MCWCDCLTQSSWWILFNRNWQELNSLAPIGGPLLLVFLLPPNSGPKSRLKLSLSCYMIRFCTMIKKYYVPLLRKGKLFPATCKHNCYFPWVCTYMCVNWWSSNFFPQSEKRRPASLVRNLLRSFTWKFGSLHYFESLLYHSIYKTQQVDWLLWRFNKNMRKGSQG